MLSHNLRLVELLREIGLRHGVSAGETAICVDNSIIPLSQAPL